MSALPHETTITESWTAKTDIDNVGAGRAAKGAIPVDRTTRKERFDTKVLNLFSLHIGSSFLSVSKQQSLVGVFNRTFARLFFFIYNNYGTKALSTGR